MITNVYKLFAGRTSWTPPLTHKLIGSIITRVYSTTLHIRTFGLAQRAFSVGVDEAIRTLTFVGALDVLAELGTTVAPPGTLVNICGTKTHDIKAQSHEPT